MTSPRKSVRKSVRKSRRSQRSPQRSLRNRQRSPQRSLRNRQRSLRNRQRSLRKSLRRSLRRSRRRSSFRFGHSQDKEEWLIYTKDGCGACERAKDLLQRRQTEHPDIDIRIERGEGKEIEPKEHKTWPKIFLNGTFVGGSVDLENKLKQLQ